MYLDNNNGRMNMNIKLDKYNYIITAIVTAAVVWVLYVIAVTPQVPVIVTTVIN